MKMSYSKPGMMLAMLDVHFDKVMKVRNTKQIKIYQVIHRNRISASGANIFVIIKFPAIFDKIQPI